jgi:hypothetical protein
MILNSTRFSLRIAADKYLNDLQLIRAELQTNRRPGYYLDIRLTMEGLKGISVYMAETNLYICGWTGDKTVIYFGDVQDPVLHAPDGFATRKLTSVNSDYGSLGLTNNTDLEISGSALGGAVEALSRVTGESVITAGLKQKLALIAIGVAEAARFRNLSLDINNALAGRGSDLKSSSYWKITHDWEDRSRYAPTNVAVKSPGI